MIFRSANISSCGHYRYRLERRWTDGPLLPFVLFNPSIANAEIDDPTIRRCMGFARREGYSGIVVGNLFAGRATNPSDLWKMDDPFGPHNGTVLARISAEAERIVAGWGAIKRDGLPISIADMVYLEKRKFVCLGKTANGSPRHPLYVRADQPFEPWPGP